MFVCDNCGNRYAHENQLPRVFPDIPGLHRHNSRTHHVRHCDDYQRGDNVRIQSPDS